MAGALNSTIAAAMIELTEPQAEDRFLNLRCGSGTLLIERQQHSPAKLIIGGDLTGAALEQARQNITAAGLKRKIRLLQLDGSRTPLPTGSFDVICADLPWGQLVGSHTDNAALYPAFLAETARLAVPGARLAVLTHELKLMERLIRKQTGIWRLVQAISIFQGGLHPKIYLFEKA
jgi:23S rRNA G2445 N2-methylase RlmL